jgi:8-oxo-dGTP pyrophosphatase MutT (NUDIX family)
VEPRRRQAVRILLLDGRERVLLFRGWDPAEPSVLYWFTPGGGLDAGESAAAGASRELFEETGLCVPPAELGEPVHHEVTDFSFNGVPYRQDQDFYLVRVPRWTVDTSGFDRWENDTIDHHHWWSAEELERTEEIYYPRDLLQLLKRLGFARC